MIGPLGVVDGGKLMFDGMEVEFRDYNGSEGVYKKGSAFALPCTRKEVEAQNRTILGHIVCVGPFANKGSVGIDLKEGDLLRYSKYAVQTEYIDGEEYDIINAEDILVRHLEDKETKEK